MKTNLVKKSLFLDALTVAALAAVFGAGRAAMLAAFNVSDAKPDFLWAWTSFRFDALITTYMMLPSVVLSVAGIVLNRDFSRAKTVYASVLVVLSAVVCIVDFYFFREYKAQFNFWIWGIFRNDALAIFAEIWRSYPVVSAALIAAVWACAVKFAFSRAERFADGFFASGKSSVAVRAGAVVLYVGLMVVGFRGLSFSHSPLRAAHASVGNSTFLNNLVPNPFYCLRMEVENALKSRLSGGLSSFGATKDDIRPFVRELFKSDCDDICDALTKRVQRGVDGKKPSRIFLIFGESNSAWPIWDDYAAMNLAPEQRVLARGGYACLRALPSGGGTLRSIQFIASGIPYTGLDFDAQFALENKFAIPYQLHKLGYKSAFYYAGPSNWNGVGPFMRKQGFDEVFGSEHLDGKVLYTEWGMHDTDMFDAILKKGVPENTFNLILTISNHPPYNIDLKAEGCRAPLATENEVKLYHNWFADLAIGRFVRAALEKYPDAVFIITGDHPSRISPENTQMNPLFDICVPIIFYGAAVEKTLGCGSPDGASQLDIMPTLLEIVAPRGFEYASFGTPMSAPKTSPKASVYAVYDGGKFFNVSHRDFPPRLADFRRKLFAVAHYLKTKGSVLPAVPVSERNASGSESGGCNIK